MTDQPHDLILDHLRHIRARTDSTDANVKELKQTVLSLREEVNAMRGDFLRQERALAAVEVDLDRIKTRLDLTDS